MSNLPDFISCHASVKKFFVKKLFYDRFRIGRTSIVFRSKAIDWAVSLLCFLPMMRGILTMSQHNLGLDRKRPTSYKIFPHKQDAVLVKRGAHSNEQWHINFQVTSRLY